MSEQLDFSDLPSISPAVSPSQGGTGVSQLPPTPTPGSAASEYDFSNFPDLNPQAAAEYQNNEKYGTIPQQALTVAEGAAEGVIGPLAPAMEIASGLTTGEAIRGRKATNPLEHAGANAAGFIGSMFVPELKGASLAGQVTKVGGLAEKAIAAYALPKIVSTGIKTGAEMAALSTSDELSKLVTGDPNQTLGTAAANIGLSGVIGSVGGAALGTVGSLFSSGAKKVATTDFVQDMQAEISRLQKMNPADLAAAKEELLQRQAAMNTMFGRLKAASVNPEFQQAALRAGEEAAKEVTEDTKQSPVEKQLSKLAPKIEELQANAPGFDAAKGDIKKYLNDTKGIADKIGEIHTEAGLAIPDDFKLDSTPSLNYHLGVKESFGTKAGAWIYNKGTEALVNSLGTGTAEAVGGGLGFLVGHPIMGAFMGERVLGKVLRTVAKPFVESAVDSTAAKATLDYIGNVIKGQRLLDSATAAMFKGGAEVLSKNLIPDQESRDKLQKSLDSFQNPANAIKVGGSLGHYLPAHATVAATTAATASAYFSNIKPKPVAVSAFDATPPINKAQQARYNRALDIAQQPLMVLKYAKEGTLMPQDVKTIQTIYPGLHKAIVSKVTQAVVEHKAADKSIPYAQRTSLNILIGGNGLDGTMTPQAMQAIVHSAGPQQAQQQGQAGAQKGNSKVSGATLTQINKVNTMYQTPMEARMAAKH